MKLVEFIKNHDNALVAKFSILELVRDGNERLGQVLIDGEEIGGEEIGAELSSIFKHIETLKKAVLAEKGAKWEIVE